MSNYIRKYTGKLFSNPLGRWLAIAGAAATTVLWPQSDDAHVERETSAFWHPTKYVEENLNKTQPPWKGELAEIERQAEEFARLATEADLNDPITELEFRKENGYTEEQCKKCEWLESPKAKDSYENARKYGVEEVSYGLPSRESDFMHFDKHGNPLESHKGAIGKLQVLGKMGKAKNGKKREVGGFDEVYEIFNNPKPRHRDFIEKYKDSIEEDAIFLRGKYEEVWKRVKYDPDVNEIVGYAYLSYLKEKSGGDINIALERYNAGWNGRKKYPNNARKYRVSVLSRQKEWDNLMYKTCPEMKSRLNALEERRYKWHKSNYLAANQSFNQRKIY